MMPCTGTRTWREANLPISAPSPQSPAPGVASPASATASLAPGPRSPAPSKGADVIVPTLPKKDNTPLPLGVAESPRPLARVGYDIYLRAGLLEYLHEQYGAAVVFFEKAKPLAPPPDYVVIGSGHVPTGIELLVAMAKSGKSITPEEACRGDSSAKAALMLIDVYHQGQEYQKSLEICNRLIESSLMARATPEQKSYVYFKRAANLPDPGHGVFQSGRGLGRLRCRIPCRAEGPLVRPGHVPGGQHRVEPQAPFRSGDFHLAPSIKTFPKSSEADRCAYFIGVARYWSKQYEEARESLEQFLEDYPDSEFASDAQDFLDKCDKEIDKQQLSPSK